MRVIHFAVLLALGAGAVSVAAQKEPREPRRPKLAASADTNDARAYYDFGIERLEKDPEQAADAFYWSSRLDPALADAFYARRVALLLTDPRRLDRYWGGDRRTLQSAEIKQIDSLALHALMLNPFLYRKLDQLLFRRIIDTYVEEESRRTGYSAGDIQYSVARYLMTAPAATKAWQAYGDGRFVEALDQYARAISSASKKASLRADRGRLFYQIGQADSALTELYAALDEMRSADKKDLVYVYNSKALLEYSVGMVQLRLGNTAAAKKAFGRALEEDMSFAPTHTQLAFMALDIKDTATALNEFELAAQVSGKDALVAYQYGFALASANRQQDALAQYQKALAIDGAYALPRFGLAVSYDAIGDRAAALREYRAFMAAASRNQPQRDDAQRRIQELSAITSDD